MHPSEQTDNASEATASATTRSFAWSPLQTALPIATVGAVVAGWPLLLSAVGVEIPRRVAGLTGTLAVVAAALAGTWMCVRAAAVHRARWRWVWLTLAATTALVAFGTLASIDTVGTTHLMREFLDPYDDLVIALSSLALCAALALVPGDRRRRSRVTVLNTSLLVAATLTLLWVLAADSEVRAVRSTDRFTGVVIFLVLNAMIFALAAGVATRSRLDRRPDLRAVVSASFILALASVVELLATVGIGSERGERCGQGLVVAGLLLIVVAGRRAALGLTDRDHVRTRTGRVQRNVPTAAVAVAVGAVVASDYFNQGDDLVALTLGAICIVLAIVRLGILERDQRRLTADLARVADRLATEATTDALTGLGNRAGLATHLADALDRRAPSGLSVFYIDVDHFKSVNDGLGHEGGDELLVVIGERLRMVLGDHVFRLGGDEFVAVRQDLDREESEAVAAALVATMEQPVHVLGRRLRAAVSVGLARSEVRRSPETQAAEGWPVRRADSADSVLRRADLALYRAKELGRGRWASYDPWLQQRADRHLQMQQGLHRALVNGEIDVYFQPIVNLSTRNVVGAEALVRWHSPEHGLVLPNDFLPVAANAGLLPEIGRLVIDVVESKLAQVGHQLSISVNLSPAEVSHPAVIARLIAASRRTDVDRLWVGIKESSVIDHASARALEQLRASNIRVAVEGFGTGPSSMRHLADYPADAICVDRSFVDSLGEDPGDTAIVEAIARLGADLGLTLVGQGVSHDRQAEALELLGYQLATGWLFGRPVTWNDFTAQHLALPAAGTVV